MSTSATPAAVSGEELAELSIDPEFREPGS